jgi:hypothetical protein
LAKLASCAIKLQINIQDGDVMVSVGDRIVNVTPLKRKIAAYFAGPGAETGPSFLFVPRQSDLACQ